MLCRQGAGQLREERNLIMSVFGVKRAAFRSTLLVLAAVVLAPMLGLLAVLSPGLAAALVVVPLVALFALMYTDAMVLLAIGLAPLGNGFVVHLATLDLRLVQVLWVVIIAALALRSLGGRGHPIQDRGAWKPLLLLVVVAFASILVSSYPQLSLKEAIQLTYLVVSFYVVAFTVRDRKLLRRAVDALIAAAALVVLFGLVKVLTGVSPIPYVDVYLGGGGLSVQVTASELIFSPTAAGLDVPRLDAFHMSSVVIAAFLSQVVLMLVSLLTSGEEMSPARRAFYWLVLAGASIALVLTFSRMALLILPVLVFGLFILQGRRFGVAVLALSAYLVAVLAYPPLLARLQDTFDPTASTNPGHYGLWLEALRLFLRRPLLGTGIGTFPVTVTHYVSFMGVQTWATGVQDVHNMFLKVAAEMGAAALAALVWFVGKMLLELRGAALLASAARWRGLLLGLILAFCAGVLMNLTTNIFGKDMNWTMWGLAYAAVLIARREAADGVHEQSA